MSSEIKLNSTAISSAELTQIVDEARRIYSLAEIDPKPILSLWEQSLQTSGYEAKINEIRQSSVAELTVLNKAVVTGRYAIALIRGEAGDSDITANMEDFE